MESDAACQVSPVQSAGSHVERRRLLSDQADPTCKLHANQCEAALPLFERAELAMRKQQGELPCKKRPQSNSSSF